LGDQIDHERTYGGLEYAFVDGFVVDLLVKKMFDSAHGGTVLILPSDEQYDNLKIDAGKRTQIDLGESLVEFLRECIRREFSENQWRYKRSRVYKTVELISKLTAVDGAVLMDRSLRCLSYGVKIQSDEHGPFCFKDLRTNEPKDETRLRQTGGMRLNSAMNFCKHQNDVIAIVASQDGDTRIIWSDATNAYIVSPIASTLGTSL
jgi:hypothetical protein